MDHCQCPLSMSPQTLSPIGVQAGRKLPIDATLTTDSMGVVRRSAHVVSQLQRPAVDGYVCRTYHNECERHTNSCDTTATVRNYLTAKSRRTTEQIVSKSLTACVEILTAEASKCTSLNSPKGMEIQYRIVNVPPSVVLTLVARIRSSEDSVR